MGHATGQGRSRSSPHLDRAAAAAEGGRWFGVNVGARKRCRIKPRGGQSESQSGVTGAVGSTRAQKREEPVVGWRTRSRLRGWQGDSWPVRPWRKMCLNPMPLSPDRSQAKTRGHSQVVRPGCRPTPASNAPAWGEGEEGSRKDPCPTQLGAAGAPAESRARERPRRQLSWAAERPHTAGHPPSPSAAVCRLPVDRIGQTTRPSPSRASKLPTLRPGHCGRGPSAAAAIRG